MKSLWCSHRQTSRLSSLAFESDPGTIGSLVAIGRSCRCSLSFASALLVAVTRPPIEECNTDRSTWPTRNIDRRAKLFPAMTMSLNNHTYMHTYSPFLNTCHLLYKSIENRCFKGLPLKDVFETTRWFGNVFAGSSNSTDKRQIVIQLHTYAIFILGKNSWAFEIEKKIRVEFTLPQTLISCAKLTSSVYADVNKTRCLCPFVTAIRKNGRTTRSICNKTYLFRRIYPTTISILNRISSCSSHETNTYSIDKRIKWKMYRWPWNVLGTSTRNRKIVGTLCATSISNVLFYL